MKRLLGTLGFTIVEATGFVIWILLALAGQGILGLGIFFVFLSIEHIITDFVIGRTSGLPIGPILIFSAIETVIWGVWLFIIQNVMLGTGGAVYVIAAVFLAITLLIEHTLSDNVFRSSPLFSKIVELRTAGFTVVEVVAATASLLLFQQGLDVLGAVVFLVGSFIEHTIAVRVAARP